MRHLDLFSGIGGFALAVENVWGTDTEHIFCDNEPFSQAVLHKNFPNSAILGDIKELTKESLWNAYVQNAERVQVSQNQTRTEGGMVDIASPAKQFTIENIEAGKEPNGAQSTTKKSRNGAENNGQELLLNSEVNVRAVERKSRASSPLTTSTMMELRNGRVEKSMETKSTLTSFEQVSLGTNTKSYVTTATSRKDFINDVPINYEDFKIDLLTGGFPCQPFSAAGRRKGTEDGRHLWPEMLRVIRETNPTWVLGENVGGFLTWDGGMVFEQVCTDLEEAGYEVCPLVIPACAVNAPHRRDRVWIAAHAIGSNALGTPRQLFGEEGEERIQERNEMGKSGKSNRTRVPSYTKHSRQYGSKNREGNFTGSDSNEARAYEDEQPERPVVSRNVTTNTLSEREGQCGKLETKGQRRKHGGVRCKERDDWTKDWPTVAACLCTLDDGLSNGLARPRGWRNAALKGAGNAIVPAVATEILRAMKDSS